MKRLVGPFNSIVDRRVTLACVTPGEKRTFQFYSRSTVCGVIELLCVGSFNSIVDRQRKGREEILKAGQQTFNSIVDRQSY